MFKTNVSFGAIKLSLPFYLFLPLYNKSLSFFLFFLVFLVRRDELELSKNKSQRKIMKTC